MKPVGDDAVGCHPLAGERSGAHDAACKAALV